MLMMLDGGPAPHVAVPPPPPPKPPKPPPAAEVSAAYQVISNNLKGKQVNAKTMQAAVAAAAAYTTLSKQAIAQAALLAQTQYDATRSQAAHKPPPKNAYAQASQELGQFQGGNHQPLFDPTVLTNATKAMNNGTVAVAPNRTVASYNPILACTVKNPDPKPVPRLPASQSAPTVSQAQVQIETYVQGGMSLQAAIAAARVQYGGSQATEPTLAEAALATQAPAQMAAYQKAPQNGDPVQLAAKQIATLKVFSQSTLDQATKAMTVKLPAKKVNGSAAQAAAAKLAKDRAAKASPATIAADMATYRAALNHEMDVATGKQGTAWFNDPTQIDAWLQGEATVADTNLLSLAQAAQGTPANSAANQALSNGEHDLNLALGETQTIADVTNTSAAQPGDSPSEAAQDNTLAQTQRLTGDLYALGLLTPDNKPAPNSKANPDAQAEYNDILNDPAIQKLSTDAQNDVTAAAGAGNTCETQTQAEHDLRHASTILSGYQGTVFYGSILAHAKSSPSVQARFNDLGFVKPGGAPDVLHEEANILGAVAVPADNDLTVALYQQKFQSKIEYSVKNDKWKVPTGLDIFSKLQAPRYYADVSNIYAAIGGKNTQAGQSLRNIVMNRMNGDNFVGYSYYGSLTKNGKDENIKSFYINWINGNGDNPKGNYQLYQDIADTDKNKDTVRFINAELPGKLVGQTTAPNAPPVYVRPGDTPLPSGPVTLTSRVDVLNTLGKAYNQTPLAKTGAGGAQYDGNNTVYGNTTLNDLVNATLASQNLTQLSAANPLVLSLTPIEYWSKDQDPQKDPPQQLWLEQTNGAAGQHYVGPAKTQAQSSYQDWLNNSGFAPGTLLSQDNLVYAANGQQRANWDQTNIAAPQKKESWEEKALHVGEVALAVGAVAVVTFVAPEADGLLLPLLYDAAQTYFAVSSAVSIADAAKRIYQDPTSWQTWVTGGFTIAASAFMDLSAVGHFGLGRAPDLLMRGLSAGKAMDEGVSVAGGSRLLAKAFDNAAGAKTYMSLAGAPDGVLATLRWTQRGAAVTNGVLLVVQGGQITDALVHGRQVSASELIQFISTAGMGQFGKVFGLQHITSLSDLRGKNQDGAQDDDARQAPKPVQPEALPKYVVTRPPDVTQPLPRLFTAGADGDTASDGNPGHSGVLDALERVSWNRRTAGPSMPPLSDRRLIQIANRSGNGGPISDAVAPHVRTISAEDMAPQTSFSRTQTNADGNVETVRVDLELPRQGSLAFLEAGAAALPPRPAQGTADPTAAPAALAQTPDQPLAGDTGNDADADSGDADQGNATLTAAVTPDDIAPTPLTAADATQGNTPVAPIATDAADDIAPGLSPAASASIDAQLAVPRNPSVPPLGTTPQAYGPADVSSLFNPPDTTVSYTLEFQSWSTAGKRPGSAAETAHQNTEPGAPAVPAVPAAAASVPATAPLAPAIDPEAQGDTDTGSADEEDNPAASPAVLAAEAADAPQALSPRAAASVAAQLALPRNPTLPAPGTTPAGYGPADLTGLLGTPEGAQTYSIAYQMPAAAPAAEKNTGTSGAPAPDPEAAEAAEAAAVPGTPATPATPGASTASSATIVDPEAQGDTDPDTRAGQQAADPLPDAAGSSARPGVPVNVRRVVLKTRFTETPGFGEEPPEADTVLPSRKPEIPAGTDVDNITSALDKRGLSNFNLLGGPDAAGKRLSELLAQADAADRPLRLMLVTGFSVDIDPASGLPMPETDGPPGTAYLAACVQKLSDARVAQGLLPIRTSVVVDSANRPIMQSVLDAAGVHDANLLVFDEPYQAPVRGAVTPYASGAKPAAHDLLDQHQPDAVIAVELPAHTAEGGPVNMRGKSVAPFNSARDAIVEAANDRLITTMGVGDGGNEAGVVQKNLPPGVTQTIPMVTMPDGSQLLFQSAVPVDQSVTAWNSNLGAQAIGVALLQHQGLLELAPSAETYGSMIDASAQAGAVDGVWRVRAASVDGFDKSVHMADTNALITAAADPHGVFLPDRPDVVVVFDSSNGALVAHDALEKAISTDTGRAVQFVYVVDHGNAPYGQYQSPEQLQFMGELVSKARQTGDEIPDSTVFVMACNTAHGAHYQGLMDLEAAQTPVVNLIETTAGLMLERGGAHPAMFATVACVKTHMYQDRVAELSNGQVVIQEVGASNWADFVNRMEHKSDDPAVQQQVQQDVDAMVARLAPDTTSVWLCCTHYPALTAQIRASLDARGMQHVQIVNPMAEQGAAARSVIQWAALPDGVTAQVRNPAPIVITTGDAATVGADARDLTGYAGVRTIHVDDFGAGMDLQAVHDALARPQLRPISRALATQWHAGGENHTASQTRIFTPNGAENTAERLPASSRAMVLVGSSNGTPNADAVTAAALLGSSMPSMDDGVETVYVTDAASVRSVRATLAAAGVPEAQVRSFNAGKSPQAGAAALLDKYRPDTVYALKVHGRNGAGQYHATDGRQLDNVTPLDEILLAANQRQGVATVGIGDAPIYAGLQSQDSDAWYEVRPVTTAEGNMVNTGSVVPADFPVTGPTATIASDGVAAALNAAGRRDVLHTPQALQAMMRAALGDDAAGLDTATPMTLDSSAHEDGLEGLRGDMTQAVHALLLSLRDQAEPPPPIDAAPDSPAPAPAGALEPIAELDPGQSGAPAQQPDQIVPGASWPALRTQLQSGALSESGAVYVYRVQGPAGQDAAAPQGLQGKLTGWGFVPQGSRKARWLGQSMPGDAPGSRIDDKRLGGLGEQPLGPQDYLVVSRTSPQALQAAPADAERFAGAEWAGPDAALNWPDGAPDADPALPPGNAAGAANAANAADAADAAGTTPAGGPRRWRRVGVTLGLSAGTAAGLIEGASNVPLLMTAAATSSLCFIYRGGMAAWRTRLGTVISRNVTGAGGTAPAQHLDWLERNLVGRGALWGIPKSVRADYGRAIATLRAQPGDAAALSALSGAAQRMYTPGTVAGNVNDALQLGTLATNVALNAQTVFGPGLAAGVDTFALSVGFGLSNTVLSTKNAATRLSGWLQTNKTAVMQRLQGVAQTTVMTGYAISTVPWALGDYATGGAVGLAKAGLDTVFGLGSAVQGFNDARALRSGKTYQPLKIGGVHPLMFLGVGAVGRFVLQLATLLKLPASPANGVSTMPANSSLAVAVPLSPNAPRAGTGQSAAPLAQTQQVSAQVADQPRAPLVLAEAALPGGPHSHRVRAGESLWEISADSLDELLTQAQRDNLAASGSDAEINAALHQLFQLNPQTDPSRGNDPDQLQIGQVITLT